MVASCIRTFVCVLHTYKHIHTLPCPLHNTVDFLGMHTTVLSVAEEVCVCGGGGGKGEPPSLDRSFFMCYCLCTVESPCINWYARLGGILAWPFFDARQYCSTQ